MTATSKGRALCRRVGMLLFRRSIIQLVSGPGQYEHRAQLGRAFRGASLADAFDPRSNSLNALRLIFAAMVAMGHGALLVFGHRLSIGSVSIETAGVSGFFVISGYLITGSWLKTRDNQRYLLRRCARIFPGYWVALIITAFVAAPLIWLSNHPSLNGFPALGPRGAATFVLTNSLLWFHQQAIAGVVANSYLPSASNGSLWSLFPEFFAYLCVLGLGVAGLLRAGRRVAPLVLVGLMVLMLWNMVNHSSFTHTFHSPILAANVVNVGSMFVSGMILYFWQERIVLSAPLAVCAAGAVVVASLLPKWQILGALPFAYLVMWLGLRLPFTSVGRKNDISYGTYLYAWPVMQVMTTVGAKSWGYVPFTLVCIGIAAACGACSWRLIEHPSMRLASRINVNVRTWAICPRIWRVPLPEEA